MKTNSEVLKIALSYLGNGGSAFRKFCGLQSGAAWCNAFVDYVAYKGGVSKLYFDGKKETYCPHSIEWCKKNLAQIPPYLAMPMDIIYFDWEKNGVPNHIGFVRKRNSTSAIYTVEGNTSGGIVAKKNRSTTYVQAIFRPHYKPASVKLAQLAIDGQFDYNDIANLQRALKSMGLYSGAVEGVLGKNTVKGLQKAAKVTADGAWGAKTSKAVQKMVGVTQDGQFGAASVKALQKWINKQNAKKPTTEEKPVEKPVETPIKDEPKGYTGTFPSINQKKKRNDLIVNEIKKLAWAYGTAKKKWAYATGAAKTACKTAMAKYGWKSKPNQSDCGYSLNTVVRETGIDKNFKILGAVKSNFPAVSEEFEIIQKGEAVDVKKLEPGDMIYYKKLKWKSQHALSWMGNNRIAEAGRKTRFFVIKSAFITENNKKIYKFDSSKIDKSTIMVIRVKPVAVKYICSGMSGNDVKLLQQFLNWYGNYGLKVDGEFGDNTLLAVKNFQKKEGLTVDGQFGQASLDKAKAVKK